VGEQTSEARHIHTDHHKIDDPQKPGLDRNKEQHKELGIRMVDDEHQQHTKVQIPGHIQIDGGGRVQIDFAAGKVDRHIGRKDHSKNIHDQHTGKIKQIKFQSAHGQLDPAAQYIEKVAGDQGHKQTEATAAYMLCENKGEKAPDLSL